MESLQELIAKSNNSETILQIEYSKNGQKIILLKSKENLELFIEILDLKNNSIKEILLHEKMYVTSAYAINAALFIDNYKANPDITLISVRHFHAIDEETFYLNVLVNRQDYKNLKINIKGEVFHLPTFDNIKHNEYSSSNKKHILKDFIFREDMILIDLNDCKERNLYEFISESFDNDDDLSFTYLYFTEDRYTIFTFPDKNIIGFEIYDKDGDEPKFSYYILKIESLENIKIMFVGKSYNSGHYYVLSEDSNEFAYRRQHYDDENNIIIRELSDNFHHSEIHREIIDEEIVYLNKRKVVLQKQNELQILDRQTENLRTILIDYSSSYEIKDYNLFYIKGFKLKFEKL